MARRRSFDVRETLAPALLGREAVQLALVAVLSAAALLFAPGWLRIVAGVVDGLVAAACGVAVVVAWRVGRQTPALVLYAAAAAVFAALAVANIRG